MVRSGNSGLRWARTSPIVRVAEDAAPLPCAAALMPSLRSCTPGPDTDGSLRKRRSCGSSCAHRGGQVDEAELPDLHLVTARERHGVDRFAVDVGAVERPHVVDGVAIAFAAELGMTARHGDIVQEDVAVRVPTRRSDLL